MVERVVTYGINSKAITWEIKSIKSSGKVVTEQVLAWVRRIRAQRK